MESALTLPLDATLRLFTIYKKPLGKPGNATRLFKSFQWKISGSNGTSEKVLLFFRTDYSKRKFVFCFFKDIFDTSSSPSRPSFCSCNWLVEIVKATKFLLTICPCTVQGPKGGVPGALEPWNFCCGARSPIILLTGALILFWLWSPEPKDILRGARSPAFSSFQIALILDYCLFVFVCAC